MAMVPVELFISIPLTVELVMVMGVDKVDPAPKVQLSKRNPVPAVTVSVKLLMLIAPEHELKYTIPVLVVPDAVTLLMLIPEDDSMSNIAPVVPDALKPFTVRPVIYFNLVPPDELLSVTV